MPPAIRSGAPNLYVGAGSLILIGMVFLGSGVRAKVNALYAGLALFLVLSFDTNWLDFLWNGMHTPNQIPYRYAYVMTFLLLVMAWEGWRNRRRLAPRAPLIVFLALTAVILLLQRIDGTSSLRQPYHNPPSRPRRGFGDSRKSPRPYAGPPAGNHSGHLSGHRSLR